MKLLRGLHNPGLDSVFSEGGCVATIGNFDGVHLGHRAVLSQVKEKASELGLPSLAIVFEPQPLEFFKGDAAPARLLSFREKLAALKAENVDAVFCLKFDADLAAHSAVEFVEKVLVQHLNIKHLVIGDDFRFGNDRSGDFELLKREGERLGFGVSNTPTQSYTDQSRISSTAIRSAVSEGNFDRVAELLGRRYAIEGRVVHGKKLGRQIGFPTANIPLKRQTIPLRGVYAVRCETENGLQEGVANIGFRPSVDDGMQANLEVHLFNFSGDLYAQRLRVEFVRKIRDEKVFDGVEQLKAQIAQDADAARAIFANI